MRDRARRVVNVTRLPVVGYAMACHPVTMLLVVTFVMSGWHVLVPVVREPVIMPVLVRLALIKFAGHRTELATRQPCAPWAEC